MDQHTSNRMTILVFTGFAVAFLATLHLRPYAGSWLVKTIPILMLALFALKNLIGKEGKLLFSGLLASAAGDILLELPDPSLFVPGMGAFILAHIFYIALFCRQPRATVPRVSILILILAYTIGFGTLLFPHLKEMTLPILFYLTVIAIMGISACMGRRNNRMVITGALIFIASDSLIAWNMFLAPIPHSSIWVMSTYYTAQALLTAGVYRALLNLQ
ncbi:MAG: lysoplasmalogenase [Desulfobacter sp.]|nr:MAG: lysoplasmalogenase [Desulfobacter sp.]